MILFAVIVLPMILLLMVVIPEEDLFIPYKFVALSLFELAAVMEPIVLFWQSMVPPLAILIPYTLVLVAPPVTVIDPVPDVAPIVFPLVVPIRAAPASISIPVQEAFPEIVQAKFWIVLF